ncbi:Acyl-CoA dehydrogenase, short-chain specific [Mycolicibacterium vanbaalenii]|uniref:Acyl-CoA dehydrogenase, short-chain specific n=1 Tax=Mycolicibacterium vanbaalenii TaxID=110539 RepID=A0A5S9RCV4_MYCVN|nr:acyl-CoA dehydrogenase family protein [Mycolicibacterium vanbaalenii]CAA0137629.1 Acyl-CoA dehydrogenase, short-chain specific [Mycolicibacterium vanbaalenii]
MSATTAGVFDSETATDEHADLRELVDGIAGKFYSAAMGNHGIPEPFDTQLWAALEETGLSRLASSSDLGAGPTEAAIVLYGLARHAAAVPIAEADLLGGWLATRAGIELPEGVATVAIADATTGEASVGRVTAVPWARDCKHIVLAAPGSHGTRVGVVDVIVDKLVLDHNLAGEPRDGIETGLLTSQLTTVDSAIGRELLTRGAWARCIQVLGALDAAATLTVTHTRERVQFGRPLSALQAVQHSLAAMAGDIERARSAVDAAISAATAYGFGDDRTELAVAVAKIVLGQVVGPVTTAAHQLHGAIGVTREHPLWLFTLRAQSWVGDYGTARLFAHQLGRLTLACDNPWGLVTGEVTANRGQQA